MSSTPCQSRHGSETTTLTSLVQDLHQLDPQHQLQQVLGQLQHQLPLYHWQLRLLENQEAVKVACCMKGGLSAWTMIVFFFACPIYNPYPLPQALVKILWTKPKFWIWETQPVRTYTLVNSEVTTTMSLICILYSSEITVTIFPPPPECTDIFGNTEYSPLSWNIYPCWGLGMIPNVVFLSPNSHIISLVTGLRTGYCVQSGWPKLPKPKLEVKLRTLL